MDKLKAREIASKLKLPAGPLSNSQLTSFIMCPKSYYFKYIERVRTPFSKNLFFGILMHFGLERLSYQLLSKSIDIQKIYKLVESKSIEELKNKNNLKYSKNLDYKFVLKGINLLLKQWRMKGLHKIKPTGIEEIIYKEIGGYPMILKIDLIDDNKKVSDYKLNKNHKTEKDVEKSLQLSLYSHGTGIKNVSFYSFKFPKMTKTNSWKPEFKEICGYRTTKQLKWCEEVVNSIGTSIVNRNFPVCDPSNWNCSEKYCDFWDSCRGRIETKTELPNWLDNIKEF